MSGNVNQNFVRIEINNLAVSYDSVPALRCGQLDAKGMIFAVIGHNGAGKSTFLKSILRLIPFGSGSIETSRIRRGEATQLVPECDMAFCPETGSVFGDITVEDYVRLWCRIKQRDPDYYKAGIGKKYMDTLQIAPLFKKLGRELSKGQRRRVQTATGFLTNPKLFLFDEPFDGLDVQKTNELVEIILDHSDEISFVISSHRMDVVERLADVIIVLQEGAFRSIGGVHEVCQSLAGSSVRVRGLADPDLAVSKLKQRFPVSLVNRIGEHVSITGKEIDMAVIKEVFAQHEMGAYELERATPSLVDAMNYHLKGLERRE